MEIHYLCQEVSVITDENWGQSVCSNIDTMSIAARTCHDNSKFKMTWKNIKKHAFDLGHHAILEFSNIEFALGNADCNKKKSYNLREWPKYLKDVLNGEEIEAFFSGSYRDLFDIGFDSYVSMIDFLKKYEKGYIPNGWYYWVEKTHLPKNDPNKRLVMKIRTNSDTGHKFRTHRNISQLSLAQSSVKNKEDVFHVVSHNPGLLCSNAAGYIARNLEMFNDIKNDKDLNPIIKPKVFKSGLMLNERVMAGTVSQFRQMIATRRTSPIHKKDVHDLTDKIELALNEWLEI